MIRSRNNSGFSLVEMLIATGIMAIGLVMVATIFPVGVKLTTLTTERTIGAIVADEAFAKIQLYGLRDFEVAGGGPNWPILDPNIACTDFQYIIEPTEDFNSDTFIDLADVAPSDWAEFLYPSAVLPAGQEQNYHFSALCRRMGAKDVQVTVFVTRKIGSAAGYRAWDPVNGVAATSDWPKPIPVNVTFDPTLPRQLAIDAGPGSLLADDSQYFFDDGYTIVDNFSGRIYRVLEVDRINGTLILQQDWVVDPFKPVGLQDAVWVVPPAVGSDRYPCVGVYQKVIRFDDIN